MHPPLSVRLIQGICVFFPPSIPELIECSRVRDGFSAFVSLLVLVRTLYQVYVNICPAYQVHTYIHTSYQVVVVVVFTLNRPFYPASSVHPVSVLIPFPREILLLWSQTVRQRKTKKIKLNRKFKCQASEVLAYRVREHTNTQHKQDRKNKSKKAIKRKRKETEIKQNTNGARTCERLLSIDGKHTNSGRAGICRYLLRGRSNTKERETQAKVCTW